MKRKLQLTINLPGAMAEMLERIIGSSHNKELVLNLDSNEEKGLLGFGEEKRKYAFIWNKDCLEKVPLEEIMWIEADGSYSLFHLTDNRKIMVSYNLSTASKELPPTDFVRIHRSSIVNLKHVDKIIGNTIRLGKVDLAIGRQYKQDLRKKIIIIGLSRLLFLAISNAHGK